MAIKSEVSRGGGSKALMARPLWKELFLQLPVRTYTFRLKTAGIQEIELPDCLKTSLQIVEYPRFRAHGQ
jgi:hypothetical protein